MEITKKQWTIIGVVVAIILVWYFFLRKKKESGFGNESGYVAQSSGIPQSVLDLGQNQTVKCPYDNCVLVTEKQKDGTWAQMCNCKKLGYFQPTYTA
jgi:hypothetical protein